MRETKVSVVSIVFGRDRFADEFLRKFSAGTPSQTVYIPDNVDRDIL